MGRASRHNQQRLAERQFVQNRPLRVAVVGTGMAGEASAYLLHHFAPTVEVTAVYEAHDRPGLSVHSMELHDGFVDLPFRAVSPHYYPNLYAMYEHLGTPLSPIDFSSTNLFMHPDGTQSMFFRYINILMRGCAVPLFAWQDIASAEKRRTMYRVIRDLFYLVLTGAGDLWTWRRASEAVSSSSASSSEDSAAAASKNNPTLQQYLDEHRYSKEFQEWFLIPLLSTMLSSTYEQVRAHPADSLLEFFCSRRTALLAGWFRHLKGVQWVSEKLLGRLPKGVVRLDCPVQSVRVRGDGQVEVTTVAGAVDVFDVVVLATEPSVAAKLWVDRLDDESAFLNSITTFKATICIHTDERFLPSNKDDWRGVNIYSLQQQQAATTTPQGVPHPQLSPMSGIAAMGCGRLALYYPEVCATHLARHQQELIETWNPYLEPQGVLKTATMERPVWNTDSRAQYTKHFANIQGRRGVFLAGAYTVPGLTLLEQAGTSAMHVALDLGARLPFAVQPLYQQSTFLLALSLLWKYRWRVVKVAFLSYVCVSLHKYFPLF